MMKIPAARTVRQRRPQSAFTMVELVVVIVIVAILAAVAIIAYNTFVEQSEVAAAEEEGWQTAKLVQAQSGIDQQPPSALTAERAPSAPGAVPFTDLTYNNDIPGNVSSVRINGAGEFSAEISGFTCSGLTYNQTDPGASPTGTLTCRGAQPPAVPGSLAAPTGLTQVSSGSHTSTVQWNAVAGATTYTVTAAPAGVGCVATAAVTCALTGLTNGVATTITVTATDGTDTSAGADVVVTVLPTPPTNLEVEQGFTTSTASWTASADADSYTVSVDGVPIVACTEITATSCLIVQNLANDAEVTVVSVDEVGVESAPIAYTVVSTADVVTVAGTGTAGNLDGNGTSAQLRFPSGVAVSTSDGAVYVTDQSSGGANYHIRKVASNGDVTTVVGGATAGWANTGAVCQNTGLTVVVGTYDPNCVLNLADARINRPRGIVVGADDNLYVAFNASSTPAYNVAGNCAVGGCVVRKIDLTAGTITGYVGNGAKMAMTGPAGTPVAAAYPTPLAAKSFAAGALGDLVFTPNGDLFFTAPAEGCIYRLNSADSLVYRVHCEPFGANNGQVIMHDLDSDAAGNVYAISYRGIYRIDGSTLAVTKYAGAGFNDASFCNAANRYCNGGMAVSPDGSRLWFLKIQINAANNAYSSVLLEEMAINSGDFANSTVTDVLGGAPAYTDGAFATARIQALAGSLAYANSGGGTYLYLASMTDQRLRLARF